jgi:hypothetical protein
VGFVVASAALHDLLRASPRAARVVAVLPAAVYVEAGGDRMVALLTRDAVRVPIGMVTAATRDTAPFAGVRVGDVASIGDGELALPPGRGAVVRSVYRPLRYWDPRVPRLRARLATAEARHRADALTALAAGLPAEVVDRWTAAARPLEAALAAPSPASDAARAVVEALVGLGPGLTPAGDDVLAGALAALAGAGDSLRFGVLSAEVGRVLSRTTPVSAALLGEACRGRAVPELIGLLRALAGGGDLDVALGRLAQVGHTSGAALALGVRSALRALDRHELGRVA